MIVSVISGEEDSLHKIPPPRLAEFALIVLRVILGEPPPQQAIPPPSTPAEFPLITVGWFSWLWTTVRRQKHNDEQIQRTSS